MAGKLVDRFGESPFLVVGPLLQAIGLGWIALVAEAGMDYWTLVPPLIVAGVGISMSFPAAQNSVVGSVPEEAIGKAAGTNSTMRELVGVLGIAIGVAAFAGAVGYATSSDFTGGFVAAISVSAGLSVLAAALPSRGGAGGGLGRGFRPRREPRGEDGTGRTTHFVNGIPDDWSLDPAIGGTTDQSSDRRCGTRAEA